MALPEPSMEKGANREGGKGRTAQTEKSTRELKNPCCKEGECYKPAGAIKVL